jgi:hypothetical protein
VIADVAAPHVSELRLGRPGTRHSLHGTSFRRAAALQPQAADDIPNKLAAVGKRLPRPGHRLKLTYDDVELLAEIEHDAFVKTITGRR